MLKLMMMAGSTWAKEGSLGRLTCPDILSRWCSHSPPSISPPKAYPQFPTYKSKSISPPTKANPHLQKQIPTEAKASPHLQKHNTTILRVSTNLKKYIPTIAKTYPHLKKQIPTVSKASLHLQKYIPTMAKANPHLQKQILAEEKAYPYKAYLRQLIFSPPVATPDCSWCHF